MHVCIPLLCFRKHSRGKAILRNHRGQALCTFFPNLFLSLLFRSRSPRMSSHISLYSMKMIIGSSFQSIHMFDLAPHLCLKQNQVSLNLAVGCIYCGSQEKKNSEISLSSILFEIITCWDLMATCLAYCEIL